MLRTLLAVLHAAVVVAFDHHANASASAVVGKLADGTDCPDPATLDACYNNIYEQKALWGSMTLFGIQFELFPLDMIIIQEQLYETKPALILETGSYKGASAMYYSMIIEHVNPACKIATVDMQYNVVPELLAGGRLEKLGSRIQFITNSSIAQSTIDTFTNLAAAAEGNVWISLDGSHVKGVVLQELINYAPLVKVGNYVLVQDTRLGRGWHTGASNNYVKSMHSTKSGPLNAVNEFLAGAGKGKFERVKEAERLLISNSGGGWLRRVA